MTEALLAAVYERVLPIREFLGLPVTEGAPLQHVVVAVRHSAQLVAPAAPSTPYEHRKIHRVCDDAIRAQLRLGIRTVLTKGWRLDHGDSLLNFSGSTHRDQLTTREWAGLLSEIGALRLFDLFASLSTCVFKRLNSSCFLQLTGVPFDDEMRLALRSPLPQHSEVLTCDPRSAAGDAGASCMRGAWALPRSDARVPFASRGVGLRYCRPLFYASSSRAARIRHGPPLGHVLHSATVSGPPGTEPLSGSKRRLPPATKAVADATSAPAGLSGTPALATAAAAVASVPPTRNAARRLIHHIFVDRPHVLDVAVYNGATGSQQQPSSGPVPSSVSTPKLTSPPRPSPPAGSVAVAGSIAAATLRRTQSRQTESCVASATSNAAGSCPLPLQGVDARRRVASDAACIPVELTGAIPVFIKLFLRHGRLRYASLLNARCPRSDVLPNLEPQSAAAESSEAPLSCIVGPSRGDAPPMPSEDLEEPRRGPTKRRRLDALSSDASASINPPKQVPPPRLSPQLVLLPAEQCAAAPLQHVTPHTAVMAYVRDCLGRVLPPALWGGADNRRHILRLVWVWVSAGKRDRLPVSSILDGCRVAGFSPLLGRTNAGAFASRLTTATVQSWISWLLLGFVTPLIRASFYVTDSEVFHHRPLYFRREVWERLSGATVLALRQTLRLMPLDPAGAVAAVGSTSLGVAGMRLSPKRGALRPIMNLAATHVGAALLDRARRGVAKDAALGGSTPGSASCGGEATGGVIPGDSTVGAARAWLQASASAPVRSVNKQLEAVFEVLKLARRRSPNSMGAAVFGLDGIYASLRRFVAARGMRAPTAATAARAAAVAARKPDSGLPEPLSTMRSPPLFMFCCDVASAYDSIVQSIAYSHVEELLPRGIERYEVRAYTEVSASGWAVVLPGGSGGTAAALQRTLLSAARTRFRRVAVACDGGLAPFHRQVSALASESHNTVFIDGSFSESVTREQCLESVRKIVWHHAVASPDGRVWRQTRGVPQGSIVSSFLCNAYLGGMERRELVPGLVRALNPQPQQRHGGDASLDAPEPCASLLMRLTDDIFLVTEDAAVAAAVQGLLCAGVPRYAVVINPGKTQASFEVGVEQGGLEAQPPLGAGGAEEPPSLAPPALARPRIDATPLSWCGLLLCPATGAVLSDYSRYLGPGGLADSLAIGFGPTPGEAVTRMMRSFLRPKCHPVLLDGHINSLSTVALNVFQLSLIAAAKLAVVLRLLGRAGGGSDPSRLSALALRTLLDATDYVVALVRRRCPGRLADVLLEAGTATTAAPGAGSCSGARVGGEGGVRQPGRVLLMGPTAAWSLDDATELCDVPPRPAPSEAGEAAGAATEQGAPGPPSPSSSPPSAAWCPLSNAEVRWLALSAFARAFTRGQDRFRGLPAALLRARMQGGVGAPPPPQAPAGGSLAEGSTQPLSSAPGDADAPQPPATSGVSGDRGGSAPPSRVRLSVRCAADPELTPWLDELDY